MNLAFLDPNSFELEFSTVEELAKVKKMDLIIYYPQMGITRCGEKVVMNLKNKKIDKYFGGDEWRRIYEKYQKGQIHNLHRELINLYKQQLSNLGYVVVEDDEPLVRNTAKRAPLYRLLFASKHDLGIKFWEQATRRDVYGQTKLF